MKLGLAGLPFDDLEWIIRSLDGRCQGLAQSNILVTGASGFIGRWIVASLVEARRQFALPQMTVEVLVRNPVTARERLGSKLWSELRVTDSDIRAAWSVQASPTHVVHGATPASVRSGLDDSRDVLLTAVLGTHRLIESVAAPVRTPRILHLSSGAVYGPQPPDLIALPENWSGGPSPFLTTAPYAEGKRAAEALLEAASREGVITAIQARLFAFLGPGLPTNEGFAIGNFAGQASRRETVQVRGDGKTVRSYLSARALAAWLILLMLDGEPGAPYNVGSPYGYSLAYWAETCAAVTGVDVVLGDEALGDRQAYVPDVSNSARIGIHLGTDDARDALPSWIEWLQFTAG